MEIKAGQKIKLVGKNWHYYVGSKCVDMRNMIVTIESVSDNGVGEFWMYGDSFQVNNAWCDDHNCEYELVGEEQ